MNASTFWKPLEYITKSCSGPGAWCGTGGLALPLGIGVAELTPLPRLVSRPCTAQCQECSLVLLVGLTTATGQSSACKASSSSPWHSRLFLPWHTSLHTQLVNIQKNKHVTNWMSHAKGEQSLPQRQLGPCRQHLWWAPSFPVDEPLEPAHF